MLNFYELLKVFGLDNMDAVSVLRESFNADFCKNYKSMQINKTTRTNAVKAYGKHDRFMMDEEHKGCYTDGVTALYIPDNAILTTKRTHNVAQLFIDSFKVMKPVNTHVKESIAMAKALGWTPGATVEGSPYHIEIEGNYYNMNLVYQVFNCIADNKISDGVECYIITDKKPGQQFLLMRSSFGCALVLPFCVGENGAYKARNCDFNFYMETENELDDILIMQAKKGA